MLARWGSAQARRDLPPDHTLLFLSPPCDQGVFNHLQFLPGKRYVSLIHLDTSWRFTFCFLWPLLAVMLLLPPFDFDNWTYAIIFQGSLNYCLFNHFFYLGIERSLPFYPLFYPINATDHSDRSKDIAHVLNLFNSDISPMWWRHGSNF